MTSTLNVSKIEPLSGSGTIHVGSDSSNTVSINTTTQAVTLAGAATINGATVPGTSNTYSLGSNTATFQSAFLGSGIYLGGTLSTNLLDNYVEGTWSPYFSDINGNAIYNESPTVTVGNYQRIGDYVTLHTYFSNAGSVTTTGSYSASGAAYVGGLPFPVPSSTFYAGVISYQAGLTSFDTSNVSVQLSCLAEGGYSVLRLHYPLGTTMVGATQNMFAASAALILAVTYKIT